jgi:NAD(P)-dependent dehydrogenase (short-subunit alcohol dehydrogenase family)
LILKDIFHLLRTMESLYTFAESDIGTVVLTSIITICVVAILRWINPIPRSVDRATNGKKLIVVTGCDTGFGLMSSTILHSQGYRVLCACLTKEGTDRLNGQEGWNAVQCDVTSTKDLERLRDTVAKMVGEDDGLHLWALVNNAGIAPIANLDWMDMDVYRKTFAVNFFAPVELTKLLLPFLKQTRDSRVVNLSSVAGVFGGNGFGAYASSKHALEGWLKALRVELCPWNVHVCAINPGLMNTPLIENSIVQSRGMFDRAPKDITDQYDPSFMQETAKAIRILAENPMKVACTIAEACTCERPGLHYYVGIQTVFVRALLMLPDCVFEFLLWLSDKAAKPKPAVLAQMQKY